MVAIYRVIEKSLAILFACLCYLFYGINSFDQNNKNSSWEFSLYEYCTIVGYLFRLILEDGHSKVKGGNRVKVLNKFKNTHTWSVTVTLVTISKTCK